MYKLQDVLIPDVYQESTQELYYRGNSQLFKDTDGNYQIGKGNYFEFFTYFNSISIEKWKKYTSVEQVCLVISVKGKFKLQQFGHFCEENGAIKKEWLGSHFFKNTEMQTIVIPYAKDLLSSVIAFSLEAMSDVIFAGAYYAADLIDEHRNEPFISLATTTFKKEAYINKNISILKNELFSDKEFENAFCWKIVDNGCTLDEYDDGIIKIMHNNNVGGAGGFAKGMIESLRMDRKPSHILLMDDDVNVSTESFRRLYRLLNILRPEYQDYFVSGAMLNMDAPNIQHENTGKISEEGCTVPLHTGRDLSLWNQVVLNEVIDDEIENRYAAWWFCCIPTTVATLDNLPLPVFVRGDDMEYSIRNHAKLITMNGISIWHQGFAGKANPIMDFYQSKRNELIIHSIREELQDVDTMGFIDELFWQELYKFNYYGCQLLVDAIKDYLKGPKWFFSADLFEVMQSKKNKDYVTKPITPKIRARIDYEKLYSYDAIPKLTKLVYDYSYNGQARIPEKLISKKQGVIPYNGGYFPSNQLLTSSNIAVDTINDRYIELKKDRAKFNFIKKEYLDVIEDYRKRVNDLDMEYKEYAKSVTISSYWLKLLDE